MAGVRAPSRWGKRRFRTTGSPRKSRIKDHEVSTNGETALPPAVHPFVFIDRAVTYRGSVIRATSENAHVRSKCVRDAFRLRAIWDSFCRRGGIYLVGRSYWITIDLDCKNYITRQYRESISIKCAIDEWILKAFLEKINLLIISSARYMRIQIT